MSKAALLLTLQRGDLVLQGQFLHGSNYTFLGLITDGDQSLKVVYKPKRGEQPLWDFREGTLTHREVAAYLVSEAIGWDLVPPTVYRRRGPLGPGSVQFYVEHDIEYHYFNFSEPDRDRLRPVVLYDLLINNADRKGSHVLVDENGHLWLIDHGVCFHVEDKLRTVIWDFAGKEIPADLIDDLQRFNQQLTQGSDTYKELAGHLTPHEISAMSARANMLVSAGVFPAAPQNRRAYPWPPV